MDGVAALSGQPLTRAPYLCDLGPRGSHRIADLVEQLKTALADCYAIERELGSGGMATVYLAEDVKHHRKVAVKVLRPELAAVLGADRFHQEIEIAANLHHPHILPLYDSGEADGFLYYVMPYEQGQSLRDKLANEGKLPVGEAVRILRDIVDARFDPNEQIVERLGKGRMREGCACGQRAGNARMFTAFGSDSSHCHSNLVFSTIIAQWYVHLARVGINA